MPHKTSKNLRLISLPLLFMGCFNALAVEVYKTVDESGATVFSDKQTHDAETVKVQPNVVDINTPVMPESSTQKKQKKQVSNSSKGTQQEMSGWNSTNTNRNVHRKVRTKTNGEGVNRHKSSAPSGGGSGGGRAGGR